MVVQQATSDLLGLLKPPLEVLAEMEKTFATFPVQPDLEYRRTVLCMWTLNFYYPRNWVAYIETDEGPDVKAVLPETLEYMRNMDESDRERVIFRGTDDWHKPYAFLFDRN